MQNKIKITSILTFSIIVFSFLGNVSLHAQIDSGHILYKTITIEGGTLNEADASIEELIVEKYPIISGKLIEKIKASRTVQKLVTDTTEGFQTTAINADYKVPYNFLLDTVKLLWELNIPEFRSHLYQIYNNDTIYIQDISKHTESGTGHHGKTLRKEKNNFLQLPPDPKTRLDYL